MATLAPVISATGIVAPTYAVILAYLKDSMRSIYGSDIYIDDDTQDGQWLGIIATAIHDLNDAIIAGYNSFSPVSAQGVGLSNLVKLNGMRRLVPSNSQVVVDIVGVAGTLITLGQIADAQNTRWSLPPTVVIPDAGTIAVTATAVDAGSVAASPGSLTQIVTPVRGWQTVTNPASATPGEPVEDDSVLRQRQSVSTSIPASSIIDATLGAIKNLPGVGRATIYENKTGTTDANGIPGHTISAVVEGGDAQTIANTIALYKTPGTGTFGTTSEIVTDPKGIQSVISWYGLSLVDVQVLVQLSAETGYVSTTAGLISASTAQWLSTLAIGADSQISKLWSPINLTGDSATTATGQTQAQLDALGATYDAKAIYQARTDNMTLTAVTNTGSNTFHVTSAANYAIGDLVAIPLDDDSLFFTNITNVAALVVTTGTNVPASRNAPIGTLMYVNSDVVIAFNEASDADATDVTVIVS